MSKGIYCIITSLNKDTKIVFGKNKEEFFKKGFYCYVGSGMKDLEARIQRHLSEDKTKFWHIDYFLDHADIIGVKSIKTDDRIECKISRMLKEMSDKTPVKGFGSSDCNCDTHLHYFKENPLANEKFITIFDLKKF